MLNSVYDRDNFYVLESKNMAYCQLTLWCQQNMFTLVMHRLRLCFLGLDFIGWDQVFFLA